MSYQALLTTRLSAGATGSPPDPDPPTPVGDGDNELLNSKFSGSGTPTNWTYSFPGEGTSALSAGTLSGHQKIQLTSASDSGDRALIEQEISVTSGDILTVSATVRAFSGSSTDPADPHVILNHTPFASAILITARPNLETIANDTVAYYTLQATTTGTLKIRFGMDRTGSVTLEAPMVDRHNGLRNYEATDPVADPDPGTLDVNAIPYAGQYIGLPMGISGNNSSQVRSQAKGARFRVKRTGTIHEWHFQFASNQNDGESSKSRAGGVTPHSYPQTWSYRIEIFNATSAWAITGSARFSQDFTIYTKDGSAPYNRVICAFTNATHGLSLAVTEGDRLLMRLTNLSGSPEDNYVSINSVSVFGNDGINWCGTGRTPPQASGYWHGDDNLAVAFSGSNTSVISKAPQNIVAVRYSDGVVDGDIAMDGTMTVMAGYVGGTSIVDQSWTQGDYYARASGLLIFAWHRSTTTPAAPLRATVSGTGITTQNLDFPAASIPARGTTLLGVVQNWATPVTFSPGVAYRLQLSSSGSTLAAGYMFGCRRIAGFLGSATGLYRGTTYSPAPQSPAPSVYNLINRHQWSGTARKSSNNGSSWSIIGWSEGGADLPCAFVLGGNVSSTLGGLT